MKWVLPVGRSPFAIIAGYLGLVSIVFVFLAPIALVLGIVAIFHIRRNENVGGMGRAIFGIVMGVLGSVLLVFFILMIFQEGV